MKVEAATKQLPKIRQCAIDAGIYEHVTLGFGTLLGYVRENGLILKDSDTDIVVLADRITREQEDGFYKLLRKNKLFKGRDKIARRNDTGRILWLSLKEKKGKSGCKSCIWFFQEWRGFYWHSKARHWVKKIAPRLRPSPSLSSDAIMKGIRAELFNNLVQREFCGYEWMVPARCGQIMDIWYKGWITPAGGGSLEDMITVVGKWKKESTWQMRRR